MAYITIIYLLHLLDYCVNLPVWYEYTFPNNSTTLAKLSFSQTVTFSCWSAYVIWGTSCFYFMYWKFYRALRRFPFTVDFDLSRYFPTNLEVNPVHIAKNPASIAFLHVFGTGLNANLCRKELMYFLFFKLYTLFDRLDISVSYNPHISVVWYKLHLKYTLPYFSILDFF